MTQLDSDIVCQLISLYEDLLSDSDAWEDTLNQIDAIWRQLGIVHDFQGRVFINEES